MKIFLRFYFIFREKGREGEKYQCVVASHMASTGDLACNPGICPDWELNRRPFVLQLVLNPLNYTSQGIFEDFFLSHSSVFSFADSNYTYIRPLEVVYSSLIFFHFEINFFCFLSDNISCYVFKFTYYPFLLRCLICY